MHFRKADVFYVQLNTVTEMAKARESHSDTAVIATYYQNNLLLPLTGFSLDYYKRLLWLYNLCLHNNITDYPTMFVYAEYFANKGPNEVISCLNFFLKTLDQSIKNFHFFVDNCFSQIKNRYLIVYL